MTILLAEEGRASLPHGAIGTSACPAIGGAIGPQGRSLDGVDRHVVEGQAGSRIATGSGRPAIAARAGFGSETLHVSLSIAPSQWQSQNQSQS